MAQANRLVSSGKVSEQDVIPRRMVCRVQGYANTIN